MDVTGLERGDVRIRVNSRALLEETLRAGVLKQRPEVFPALCVVIDKLDKIGADAVVAALVDPQGEVSLPEPDARFLVDVDDEWGGYSDLDLRIGLDVGLRDLIRFRSGYAFLNSQSRGPSVGVGIRVGRIAVNLARVFFVSSNFDGLA